MWDARNETEWRRREEERLEKEREPAAEHRPLGGKGFAMRKR